MDKEIQKYIPVAKMISATFGHSCEVVLHDLADPQHSVVYVANNSVTGRTVGQSFDHLIKDVLLSSELSDDNRSNYVFATEKGKKIKSSTSLIRNESGRIIGALCINLDVSAFEAFSNFIQDVINSDVPAHPVQEEDTISNVVQVLDDIVDGVFKDIGEEKLSKTKRLELISFLDSKGVFLIKGSIEKVATALDISTVTVYSYLDEIRKGK